MKFAFFIRNLWFYRNVAPVVSALARRGHTILILHGRGEDEKSSAADEIAALIAANPESVSAVELTWKGPFNALDVALSLAMDRLHFADRRFAEKPIIRKRAETKAQGPLLDFARYLSFWPVRRWSRDLLARLAQALPPHVQARKELKRFRPHLAVFCPLIDVGHPQFDQVRAAHAVKARAVAYVHSWDNLSSKSWLRRDPDAILVWNEMQRREAIEIHNAPDRQIVVCGAAPYDDWFEREPSVGREEFLTGLGLDPARKTILYVGSALFRPPVTKHLESEFLHEWIVGIRSHPNPDLRAANIIIRPHPKQLDDIDPAVISAHANVRVWPAAPENPVSQQARVTYLHSITHSDAVVGVNTSAFLEAALLGKPVLTVLDPRYQESQEGTFHFNWLIGEGGAPIVRADRSLAAHLARLGRVFSGAEPYSEAERRAILAFVRPAGEEISAVEAVCEALHREARKGAYKPTPLTVKVNAFLLERVLTPMKGRAFASRSAIAQKRLAPAETEANVAVTPEGTE